MDSFERKGSYYTASLEIDRSSVNNNVSNLDNNSNNLDLKFFFFLPIYQLKILESTSTLFFLLRFDRLSKCPFIERRHQFLRRPRCDRETDEP